MLGCLKILKKNLLIKEYQINLKNNHINCKLKVFYTFDFNLFINKIKIKMIIF